MMAAVDQVKLPPLRRRQRSQNRVVQEFAGRSQLLFAERDDVIHFGDFRANLGQNFLPRQAARTCYGRSFPARWKISQPYDDESAAPLLQGWFRRQWLAGAEYALKSFHRSGIGQVQMFQYFCGAPLSRWLLGQLLGGKSGNRGGNFPLQYLKVRVHDGYLPFYSFRLECCATHKTHSRYHRKDAP